MNKFRFYFILLITTVSIFSCSKNDDGGSASEPLRDYTEQYKVDSLVIDDYLRGYYIEKITDNPGQTNDQDIILTKIPDGGTQPSIMSYLNATTGPILKSKIVQQNGIDYTLYYLVLREGTGDSPCNVDGVFTAYEGSYLYRTVETEIVNPVKFEKVTHPSEFLSLFDLIVGWSETFPEFKMGTNKKNGNGTIAYSDFGAGVMFLPSGLAYYSKTKASIPAYSPLVFSFKLYDIKRLDQDEDGIPSYLEDDITNDGYMRVLGKGVSNPDDTDKDGIPDFLDVDDDGDNYTTKLETQYIHPSDPKKTIRYYPFNGFSDGDPNTSDDDLTTPYVDESKGIPGYTEAGIFSYTDPSRLRIHLDKEHHTATPKP